MAETNLTVKCLVCSHLKKFKTDPSIRACELDLDPDDCEEGNRENAGKIGGQVEREPAA